MIFFITLSLRVPPFPICVMMLKLALSLCDGCEAEDDGSGGGSAR